MSGSRAAFPRAAVAEIPSKLGNSGCIGIKHNGSARAGCVGSGQAHRRTTRYMNGRRASSGRAFSAFAVVHHRANAVGARVLIGMSHAVTFAPCAVAEIPSDV